MEVSNATSSSSQSSFFLLLCFCNPKSWYYKKRWLFL